MPEGTNIKQQLLDSCIEYVDNRVNKIKSQIKTIQESLLNETKSTAGDKHETGRAMVQLEREKVGQQLLQAEKLQQAVSKINIKVSSEIASLGSVVTTSLGNYFIAISAGKINIKNTSYFAIAPDTPIGKLLMGKKKNDEVNFNGNRILIQKVL